MDCDKCGKPVEGKENIFSSKFSETEKISVHKECARKTGGLDYFHGLRHTVWPQVVGEYNLVKKVLGERLNK
jgi:hypothetical protein